MHRAGCWWCRWRFASQCRSQWPAKVIAFQVDPTAVSAASFRANENRQMRLFIVSLTFVVGHLMTPTHHPNEPYLQTLAKVTLNDCILKWYPYNSDFSLVWPVLPLDIVYTMFHDNIDCRAVLSKSVPSTARWSAESCQASSPWCAALKDRDKGWRSLWTILVGGFNHIEKY